MKILLIEDDQHFAATLKVLLEMKFKGCKVHSVDRLLHAFQYLENEKVDIILTDLSLAGRNASKDQTLKRIPELLARAPVIVVTGDDSDETWQSAIDAKATDFWVKTRDNRLLMERISVVLSNEREKKNIARRHRQIIEAQEKNEDQEKFQVEFQRYEEHANLEIEQIKIAIFFMAMHVMGQVGKELMLIAGAGDGFTSTNVLSLIGSTMVAFSVAAGQYWTSRKNNKR